MTFLAETLMPAWFILPVATLVLLVLGAHLLALGMPGMEARRRRIRMVNNLLMMFTTPLMAYGFGIVDATDGRRFALVWTVIPLLLLMIVGLAVADIVNTMVLHAKARRLIRRGPGPVGRVPETGP
jgi:hypothetical protein